MTFAWRCFPLLGLELKFFGVDGGLFHITYLKSFPGRIPS